MDDRQLNELNIEQEYLTYKLYDSLITAIDQKILNEQELELAVQLRDRLIVAINDK